MVGPLDMARHEDRRILTRAIADGNANRRKRWGVDDGLKEKAVKALEAAMEAAQLKGDHRAVNSGVDTLARREAQNQAEEHFAEKNKRRDEGKATERVEAPIKFIKGIDRSEL